MEENKAFIEAEPDVSKLVDSLRDRMEHDESFRDSVARALNGIKLEFELELTRHATLPSYAHDGDAGMDVCAIEDVDLRSGVPTLVHTGLRCKIPEGYELQVRPRSGLALKGVTVWNAPGTIDSKYRGEIGVILMYMNNHPEKQTADQTKEYYVVHKGDKIAQLVLAPVYKAWPVEVEKVDTDTDRGEGGFGSTGV